MRLAGLRRNGEKQSEESAEGKSSVWRGKGQPHAEGTNTLRPDRWQWEERGTSPTDSMTEKP